MREERPARGSSAPGESFFYNNWDFNLPGNLLERASGKSVGELFEAWIARPLGMEDFRRGDVCAELEPTRSLFPAHAFRMSARDLARFGLLYLQQGKWQGREVVPASWVAESTRAHSDLGDGRGYGLLWWTYAAGSLASCPTLNRHDVFAAIGTGGQLVLVSPGAEFVFVHRGDTENERHVGGGKVWDLAERILAAREAEPEEDPELVPVRVEPLPDAGEPVPDRAPVRIDPARYAGLEGEYAFDRGPSVRVFVHAGRLFVHRSDGEEAELFPLSDSRFFLWVQPMEVEFRRDATGKAVTATVVTRKGRMEGKRS
jgi:CubicO group peptidase (beta-lactamase class C family)